MRQQDPSLSLCEGCGLCCDGTLFENARIDADELESARAAGLEIVEGSPPYFSQPCARLCDGRCTIYPLRPGICRTFRCKLARRVEQGEVGPDAARAAIASAKEIADRVRQVLPPGTALDAALRAWRANPVAQDAATPEERMGQAEIHVRVAALNLFLDQHFRSEKTRLFKLAKD